MHRDTGLRTFADVLIGERGAPRRSSLLKLHDSVDWDRIGELLKGPTRRRRAARRIRRC